MHQMLFFLYYSKRKIHPIQKRIKKHKFYNDFSKKNTNKPKEIQCFYASRLASQPQPASQPASQPTSQPASQDPAQSLSRALSQKQYDFFHNVITNPLLFGQIQPRSILAPAWACGAAPAGRGPARPDSTSRPLPHQLALQSERQRASQPASRPAS